MTPLALFVLAVVLLVVGLAVWIASKCEDFAEFMDRKDDQ